MQGLIPFPSKPRFYCVTNPTKGVMKLWQFSAWKRTIAILTAFSILPLLAVAAAGKNYILPVCVTLVYTFLSFILLMVNMYLHPLSSATAIIMRDIPGVILAQEVNIPAALFCIGIWTIVSIVFAYISLKHRK